MSNGKSLKPKQLSAVRLLASGAPAYRVAEQLEVSTMTIYRWRRLPEFNAKLYSITNSGLEEIAKKLNATTLTAVETLQEVLCDMTQPAPTRIKAALGVLGVMSSVNGALEKSLQHRLADFDLAQRFEIGVLPYDAVGSGYSGGEGAILSAEQAQCIPV
ncbi:MAG: hypothetical protein MOGDAGHF_01107 [Rhodocyclaceae bacterium]|nr:hypothetical protein [Rhodocyclaceae bacterium]